MLPLVRRVTLGGHSRPYMRDGEQGELLALLQIVYPLQTVAEFGVNEGRTARFLLAALPAITCYIGVDVASGYTTGLPTQQAEVPITPGLLVKDSRFTLLTPSRGTLDLTKDDLPICDAVFVDGDHSRAAVQHDSQLANAITRPGGIIVWHDYGNSTVEVTSVLDDLYNNGRALRHIEDTWLAYERKL